MTTYLFDTSVTTLLVEPRAAKRSPAMVSAVEERVRRQGGLVISVMTQFELRRGVRLLRLRGRGRAKEVRVERLLRTTAVLPLDGPHSTWDVAAEIYAYGRSRQPAIVLSDADLLIAATAVRFQRTLVTSDARLAENLAAIGQGLPVELVRNA